MISSMNFNDSFVLLKCFGLEVNKKLFGNFYQSMLPSVFPSYISCIGKISLIQVMPKVAVMACLSVASNNNDDYKLHNV